MELLKTLLQKEHWEAFLTYKESTGNISKYELEDLRAFVSNEEYLSIATGILAGKPLSLPNMGKINKKSVSRKRIVFTYCKEENYVLKMLAFQLHKYDSLFANNLYSFRRDKSVKDALRQIIKEQNLSKMYSYKVDIHDYFNSVDTEKMIELLHKHIVDDPSLCEFISTLLREEYVLENGIPVRHKKGIMAGMPLSGFLANLYLSDLDYWFYENRILYARYSDDILVFAKSESEIQSYAAKISEYLTQYQLSVNEKKEFFTKPCEKWNFLGFSYCNGEIDIADASLEKLKRKMKRKARALLRWKERTGADAERTVRAFIRHFNKKFFDNPIHNDITWGRWYFPIITTSDSLKIIDQYMVDCIRYLALGKHSKAKFNLRYETIKEYGFRSLVHEYYKAKI